MYSGSTRNSGMLNVRKCICTQVVTKLRNVKCTEMHMYSGSTRNSGMLNARKCICTQVVHETPEC